jgi:hypothetical protein
MDHVSPMVVDVIVRHWVGGGPTIEPTSLPFWVIVITAYIYIYILIGNSPSLECFLDLLEFVV